jgi:DNA ligase D-like protein (predicted ligase)
MHARFIPPMLLLRKERLPEGPDWLYEIKLDGYRALAIKSGARVQLRSRNDNDFSTRYRDIAKALAVLPDDTVIDGEVVALDENGRPSFNLLQNYGSAGAQIVYYVFDVLVLAGRDVMREALDTRRELLEEEILPHLDEPIRYSQELRASLSDLIEAVKAQGFEGLVAKNRRKRYEPGQRSGAWQKMRVNRGQDFVIGGYTVGGSTFDALVFGYYEGKRLLYAARTRNGFTPALRVALMERFQGREIKECPFENLPELKSGRWGQGLTAEKMKECRWLKPVLVGQFEFVEWTPDNHLRHSKFISIQEDRNPKNVVRNSGYASSARSPRTDVAAFHSESPQQESITIDDPLRSDWRDLSREAHAFWQTWDWRLGTAAPVDLLMVFFRTQNFLAQPGSISVGPTPGDRAGLRSHLRKLSKGGRFLKLRPMRTPE